MPIIKLPDGNNIKFENKVTGLEVAEKISKSLAKQALIVSVDGELKDLSYEIKKDSNVKIITSKDKEGLEVLRHDAAHIMAMAVQELFSGTQVTIGPVIELDQDTLNSIGNEGRKNVIKKFDVEAMCDSTLREYKKLLNI